MNQYYISWQADRNQSRAEIVLDGDGRPTWPSFSRHQLRRKLTRLVTTRRNQVRTFVAKKKRSTLEALGVVTDPAGAGAECVTKGRGGGKDGDMPA